MRLRRMRNDNRVAMANRSNPRKNDRTAPAATTGDPVGLAG
jgi:hypothetical protein